MIRKALTTPSTRRALILGCLLQAFQQLAGIIILINYKKYLLYIIIFNLIILKLLFFIIFFLN